MLGARLYGPRDLRVEAMEPPGKPAAGDVLLRVAAVGLCGSDLHLYADERPLGDTAAYPVIPGHEFAGVVEAVGANALDAEGRALTPGVRVAVDPAQPCGQCALCERGHPNLCERLRFCGLAPCDGALRELMHVPARCCWALPAEMSDAEGALLETLGVALHALELGRVRVGDRVAVVGAGPIGLCIVQAARAAGAAAVEVYEPLAWRRELAERLGGRAMAGETPTPPGLTGGTPVPPRSRFPQIKPTQADVVFEAAWAGEAVQTAVDCCRAGARLVLVGIPRDDRLELRHSAARRKGLTILLCRRMKHAYARARELARRGMVDLTALVSHRFPLREAPAAFALNAAYADRVVKVVVEM